MLCIFLPELVYAYYSKLKNKLLANNPVSCDGYLIKAPDDILPDSSVIENKGIFI